MIHIIGLALVGFGVFCLLSLASIIAVYIAVGTYAHAESKPKEVSLNAGYWIHFGVLFIFLGIGLMVFG